MDTALISVGSTAIGIIVGAFGAMLRTTEKYSGKMSNIETSVKSLETSNNEIKSAIREATSEVKQTATAVIRHELTLEHHKEQLAKIAILENEQRKQGHDIRALYGKFEQLPEIKKFLAE